MLIPEFSNWLSQTHASEVVSTVTWIIPATQIVNIVAVTIVFASMLMLDLRMMGLARTKQSKMVLLVLAGANMMFFHVITFRNVHLWDKEMNTPMATRLAGGISLTLWIAIIVCDRIVGWTAS